MKAYCGLLSASLCFSVFSQAPQFWRKTRTSRTRLSQLFPSTPAVLRMERLMCSPWRNVLGNVAMQFVMEFLKPVMSRMQ